MRLELVIFLTISFADAQQLVSVETPLGTIIGTHVDYGSNRSELYYGEADVFLGIPYVVPPVGENRFKKPVLLCQLPTSPYNATYFRPACPQNTENIEQSEDCLQLNVFTPNVKSHAKLPVMVWIHGGAMVNGRASMYSVKGGIRNLVSRGVVLVTIQYRIGLLGFFTTFTDDFPPNLGMLDQVEALRWVSKYIQYFGGDPYRITIFGESAGGASVSAHTHSPLSQGLFQQAIMESGVTLTCFEGSLGFTGLSKARAQALCNFTDWDGGEYSSLKACLLAADYKTFTPLESTNLLGWKIAQDNYFMPDVPDVLAASRPNIPVLIGSNRDEWTYYDLEFLKANFTTIDTYGRSFFELEFFLFAGFLLQAPISILNLFEDVYLPPGTNDTDHVGWLKTTSKIFTMAGFTGFVNREIRNYLANGNREVYIYEFVFESDVEHIFDLDGWRPVVHTAELPFIWVFESMWQDAFTRNAVTPADLQMVDLFGHWWTNFAKYGKPTFDDSWEPISPDDKFRYWEIGGSAFQANGRMRDQYRNEDHVMWNLVLQSIIGPLPPECPDFNNGTFGCKQQTVDFSIIRQSPEFASFYHLDPKN